MLSVILLDVSSARVNLSQLCAYSSSADYQSSQEGEGYVNVLPSVSGDNEERRLLNEAGDVRKNRRSC